MPEKRGCHILKIIKKVIVKQVVTEKSKERLHKRFLDSKMVLEQEYQQLLFEQRKLQNKKGISKQELKSRFQKEKLARKEKIKMVDFKIEQLDILEIGSEIVEKEMEALIDVQVGDNWEALMKEKSIVVKDNIVIRIDE